MPSQAHVRDAKRDLTRWEGIKTEYESLKDFVRHKSIGSGIHSIFVDCAYIDLRVLARGDDTTLIVFHGAVPRNPALALPVFYGRSFEGLPINLIMIGDPCLCWDADLQLSWYLGAEGFPAQTLLVSILAHVIERMDTKNMIFLGSSGGGFASLFNSYCFPGSLGLAINPQTVLRNHHVERVRPYLKACFGREFVPGERLFRDPAYCEDLAELYGGSFQNFVLYVQNERDEHVRMHMKPFLEAVEGRAEASNRLAIHLGRWGDGHVALPRERMQAIVRNAVESRGDWASFLASHQLQPVSSTV